MMKQLRPQAGHLPQSRTGWLRALAARLKPVLAVLGFCAGLLTTTQASAATLQGPISGWEQGAEPQWVSMYIYVPDVVVESPPILTIVHFCGGSAALVYQQARDGGMLAAADEHGFILLFPQTSQNCWDVATEPSLTHGAGGDTLAIVHQVDYVVTNYGANPDRVYVTGTSSGAMTTQAMAAVYPDVFKGGVAFAGVPAGCWSVNNPDGQWSADCAGGQVTKSAEEWGEQARNMFPDYTGPRMRLQLWHGTADSVLSPVNQTESVKQWTNVMGLDPYPTQVITETIEGGEYTREQWLDSCENVILDVWTQPGGPHGTDANMNAAYSIPFLALDQPEATDPQADCVETPGGSGGAGGGAGAATGVGGDGSGVGAGAVGGVGSGGMPAASTGGRTTGNGNGNGNAGAAELPTRPTMACDFSSWQGRTTPFAFAWGAMIALLFARRRRRFSGVSEN